MRSKQISYAKLCLLVGLIFIAMGPLSKLETSGYSTPYLALSHGPGLTPEVLKAIVGITIIRFCGVMVFWIVGAAGIFLIQSFFQSSQSNGQKADATASPASQDIYPKHGDTKVQSKDQKEDAFIASMKFIIAALIWISGIVIATAALGLGSGVVVTIVSPWLFPALYRFATRNSR